MAKHASDDWLTTAAKWPGLDDDPLGMRRGRIIREAADLPLLIIQQPADTLLWGCRSTCGRSLFGMTPRWRLFCTS